jgi:hypothetical protein
MTLECRGGVKDEIHDLSLLMITARDLIAELSDLAIAVERCLNRTTDVDEVISLLNEKKTRVDTLNTVALEITTRLRLRSDGSVGLAVPEDVKAGFQGLMEEFRRLMNLEARLEDLIAGRGFPVSRRLR